MIVNDQVINERRVRAMLDEEDLSKILCAHVAMETGFEIRKNTRIRCFIKTVDSSIGPKREAEIELVNDLPEGGE